MTVTTTMNPATARAAAPTGSAPSALRLGLARGGLETRQFFRNKGQMFFTFSMPVVMLLLLGSIYRGTDPASGVSTQQIFTTGMIGVGIMGSSLQSLSLQIAGERRNGTLKRLRGTPLPKSSYFIGKILMVLASSLGQGAVLLGIGRLFFDVRLPVDAAHWLTLGWVYLLGVAGCSLLGIAYSNLMRGADSGAVAMLPMMVLQFISGVFVILSQLPHTLQLVASFFPLKWICQGMRSALLPQAYAQAEPAGGWEHGRTALVLAVWAVAGLLLCLKTFRWKGREDG
ncbi:ABC transporter permease [Streptacidiphilus sp. N1-12]|uniref:ABC transporter permease n=2 Tax=Streptacidiphilus alkalitolerans TaxID=3342712 RepID=A0ABV6WKH9_9ACTN